MPTPDHAAQSLSAAVTRVSVVTSIAIVALFLINAFYLYWFVGHNKGSLSSDPAAWGVYGDFVGGAANPIISIATLLIVALAYIAQRQELAATTTALASTALEQKRLTSVSMIQGQIHAQAALLSRKIDLRVNIYSEIQRLGTFDPKTFPVSELGEPLNYETRLMYIGELRDRKMQLDAEVGLIEDQLSILSARLAQIEQDENRL